MTPELLENEHIEYLADRLRLIVSPEHTFGTDALLLAAFAAPRPRAAACDLGAGCGVIPFYWFARGLRRAAAVELQAQAVDQMRRSAMLSGLTDELTVVHADLRELAGILEAGSFDLVTMNPPYTKAGHGIESRAPADKIARHETAASLEEICATAARLLKFGGRFCICLRPERLGEAVCAMHGAGVEPKRLRFAAKTPADPPWLMLLEGKKGRNPGMTVEKNLFLYNGAGGQTEELRAITAPYRKD